MTTVTSETYKPTKGARRHAQVVTQALTQALLLSDGDGKVLGGDAVKFFQRSGVPQQLLAKVRRPRFAAEARTRYF